LVTTALWIESSPGWGYASYSRFRAERTLNSPRRRAGPASPANHGRSLSTLLGMFIAIATPALAQQNGAPCWCQIDVSTDLIGGQFAHSSWSFGSINPYYGNLEPDGTWCPGGPQTISIDGGPAGICWPSGGEYNDKTDCPIANGSSLSNGSHTADIHCTGGWSIIDNSGVQNYDYIIPFISDDNGLSITITTAPPNGAILGLQAITISGTASDLAPLATINGGGVAGSTSAMTWSVTLDPGALLALVSIQASSGPVTVGIEATDILGNVVTYSNTKYYGTSYVTVDPTLAGNFIIDYVPPVVTFDLGTSTTVTTFSAISGLVTDNFQLGTLSISIQDTTGGSSSYWNAVSSSFQSGNLIQIPITINSGPGVTSSRWRYAGFNDGKITPGHTYLVSAYAADSVNNVSTTTLTMYTSELVDAVAEPPIRSQHTQNVTFSPAAFVAQYSPTSISVCAKVADGSILDFSQLTVKSALGAITANISSLSGCDFGIQISANLSQCVLSDIVQVFYQGQLVGELPGHILIPTSETVIRSYPGLRNGDSYAGLFHYVTRQRTYEIAIVGPSFGGVSMDLTGATFHEEIHPRPITIAGIVYPQCTNDEKAPLSDTFSFANQGIEDTYGPHDMISLRQRQILRPEPGGIECGREVGQTYYVNTCAIPSPPSFIDMRYWLLSPDDFLIMNRVESNVLGN
jgi:hypothetical protein